MMQTKGERYLTGTGYIALPVDIGRAQYIRDCYMNFHVSIITEDGSFLNRVPIPEEVLNFIDFPTSPKEMGTQVVYVVNEFNQNTQIVARLTDRSHLGDGREHQFSFRRKYEEQLVEIVGNSKEGFLSLNVNGGERGGVINISLFNAKGNGKFKLDISGDVEIVTTGETSFLQQKQWKTETVDGESGESSTLIQSPTETKVLSKKMSLNEGDNPVPMGNQLVALLEKLIETVGQITVATAIGTQPIINKLEFVKMKEEVKKILSKEMFIKD